MNASNSDLYGHGSQLATGSEVACHATQVAGMLCSINGGSVFLKDTHAIQSVKSRASMIPRHSSSSFATQNYTTVKELGKGSFSRVDLLRDKRSGVARVLKISEGGVGSKQSQMLKNEIHLLSALDHPNIAKLYEYSEDISCGQLLMVLEFVSGGDCHQLLRSAENPQNEGFIAKIIGQLLGVLCYCHARGILHCDVKPENMMLTQVSGGGMPDCKVIDFGLAHRIDRPPRDFVGTPSYMAPEIVKGTYAYTIKSDVWSAGVTACELLASQTPFGKPQDYKGFDIRQKMEPVLQNIRTYARFQDVETRLAKSKSATANEAGIWKSRSATAKDFIRSIIIADPADRPHADQALEHVWLERNKVWPSYLSSYMLSSMVKFMGLNGLMRRCLLIIATRLGSPKMGQIGDVFLSIDDRHTGHVSREDLANAVSSAATCWEPEFDVDDFFDAADQEQKDVLSFLEFTATCLWGVDDTKHTIAERVFKALDDNHDGFVNMDECRHFFRECDLLELRGLPSNRAFGIHEWLAAAGASNDPPSKRRQQPEESALTRLLNSFLCSVDDPSADEYEEMLH